MMAGGFAAAGGKEFKEGSLQEKINEIWREPPEIDFPPCLVEKLDLPKLH
jgi:hypothetical protein